MGNDTGVILYKYYAFTEYNVDAFKYLYWFFSKPNFRNDPFDGCKEIFELVLGHNIDSDSIGQLQDFGVCCFSKTAVNPHLWALYADSHNGFVLEYEFSENDYFNLSSKGIVLPLFDISYVDNISKPTKEDLIEFESSRYFSEDIEMMLPDRRVLEYEDLKWYYALSAKQKSTWEIENEIRMFLGKIRPKQELFRQFEYVRKDEDIAGYKIYYPKSCLKRCIIGLKTPPDNITILKEIAQCHQIPITYIIKGLPFQLIEKNNFI